MPNAPITMIACLLALLLLIAAAGDLRARTIPNWLNGAIAIAAPLWWWATGVALWPDLAVQIGLALFVFALFAGAFAAGWMGGGDVKLIGAVALWLTPFQLARMLVLMSLAGGALTLAMVVLHKARRRQGQPEIPYGVAIAGATAWVIANDMLTIMYH